MGYGTRQTAKGNVMSFKESLKGFIASMAARNGEAVEVDDEDNLFDHVTLDSMGVLEVTQFIEEQTGLRIPDRELKVDNFQSIASIEDMVQRLSREKREAT